MKFASLEPEANQAAASKEKQEIKWAFSIRMEDLRQTYGLTDW